MPLETAATIDQLDPLNPVHTDGLNQADSHFRLIKAALQGTFPNVAGVVTATAAGLNSGGALLTGNILTVPGGTLATTGGQLLLDGAAVTTSGTLVTAPNASLQNVAGVSTFQNAGGTAVAVVDQLGNLGALASIGAPIIIQGGHPLLPTGCIVMWSGATTNVPAGWQLCDGTNGSPNLIGLFLVGAGPTGGSGPVAGQTGGTNLQTVLTSTIGAHSHGGATALAGAHQHTGVTDNQGTHSHTGSTSGYALTINDMPAHDHGVGNQNIIGNVSGSGLNSGGPWGAVGFSSQGGGAAHAHPIVADGLHQHNVLTNAGGPDHTHSIGLDGSHNHIFGIDVRPAYYAICYIFKL